VKPPSSHQHVMLEPVAGGGYNVYALVFVERIAAGDPRCAYPQQLLAMESLTPRGRMKEPPVSDIAEHARPSAPIREGLSLDPVSSRPHAPRPQDAPRTPPSRGPVNAPRGSASAPAGRIPVQRAHVSLNPNEPNNTTPFVASILRGAQIGWQGIGAYLAEDIRNTDPRLFAIGFARGVNDYADKSWTMRESADAAATMLAFDENNRPLAEPATARGLRTPDYGFTDEDLQNEWVYRVMARGKSPASFDLSDSLVRVPIVINGRPNGVCLYLANRTHPQSMKQLPPVDRYLDQTYSGSDQPSLQNRG
jgi:hypothetical protein